MNNNMFSIQRIISALNKTEISDGRWDEARLLLSTIKHLQTIGEGSMVAHFFLGGTALYVGERLGVRYYILLAKRKGVEYVAQITTEMP